MAEKEKIEKTIVVPELPTQQARKAELSDGEIANLLTISEALTEIYDDVKAIRKATADSM